jgi:hypothetical protein
MPKRLTPEDRWESDFEVPIPGDPRRIGPLEVLFQRLLNRTERLKNRIAAILGLPWDATPPDTLVGLAERLGTLEAGQGGTTLAAHRTAPVLDHPDSSVTAQKLAPVRDAPTITPSPGDWLLGGLASGTGVGKVPIGLANGIPLLNSAGALAASNAYLDRGLISGPVDWNSLTEAGVYKIHNAAFGSGAANYPPTSYEYGILLVFRSYSPAAIVQVYIPHMNDDYIYFREAWSQTDWSPWRAVGAVYGSNSNGSYVRFADGTQICWAAAVGAGPDPQTVTYPAAFASPPAVVVTPAEWVAGHISVDSQWEYGTTQQRFRKYDAVGNTYTGSFLQFNYIAIGRWK